MQRALIVIGLAIAAAGALSKAPDSTETMLRG